MCCPAGPRPLHTDSSSDHLTPAAAGSSGNNSAIHSPAYHAMLQSPLASTHSKFPLPGDPGYVKRQYGQRLRIDRIVFRTAHMSIVCVFHVCCL
jgi:hypothetical protein